MRYENQRSGLLLCGIAWILCHAGIAAAQPKQVSEQEQYGPTRMPDRVILNIAEDPTTSQSVTWRTSTDVDQGFAQIAVAGPNKEFMKNADQIEANYEDLQSELGTSRYHSVTFENLEPATKYLYRVGDGANWTEWSQFQTASKEAEPFSFIYFGDAQNDVREHWSRVLRQSFMDDSRARFFLHAGDLINNANNDAQWGGWHSAGGWTNMSIPSIMTPGNHEYGTLPGGLPLYRLSTFWRPQFTLPQNGPEQLKETVYYFDYQGVRFIVLNSNEYMPDQVPWLEEALSSNPCKWTIVTFHHPIYSAAKGRDNPIIRGLWQPLFDKYKVDLVLQGHDHSYARTGLILGKNESSGTSARSEGGGTVYVVSVSGPKMYGVDKSERMHRAAANTQLYQIISIDGKELRYEARTATGEPYDAFTLKKTEGGPNELIDRIPDTPERLN